MSQDIILKAENLSKQYQLGVFGTRTLSGDVHRWWMTKVRGKEDPFSKVGVVNDRASKEKADFVWALKDINFEVKRGEVLGIIGKNGAGKSTLLKLLSRVTSPTTGRIRSKGRMASLLEVGTGFHPELTGLENIYLNGAILGMTKAEIKRKLDEIVDFSGCALYIDTPVKRYSSGMKVRLGFAVAAFLDPEILIVDEVLAVGDAEFQKKAIGKMKDVSQGDGRTVLFVSHNMASVNALCDSAILLKNGLLSNIGSTEAIISEYLTSENIDTTRKTLNYSHDSFELKEVTIQNTNSTTNDLFRDQELDISFEAVCKKQAGLVYYNIKLKNEIGEYFLVTTSKPYRSLLRLGENFNTMKIPAGFFNEGKFMMELMVIEYNEGSGYQTHFHDKEFMMFTLLPEKRQIGQWMGKAEGYIKHTFEWL